LWPFQRVTASTTSARFGWTTGSKRARASGERLM
jgi:hypothetical protein